MINHIPGFALLKNLSPIFSIQEKLKKEEANIMGHSQMFIVRDFL